MLLQRPCRPQAKLCLEWVIYRARDVRLDRTVAIKLLPEEFSGRADRRQRFHHEARLISGSPIITGDLPAGIPITVGRERFAETLAAINAFRASRNLLSIDDSLMKLNPYRSVDLRLTKAVHAGRTRRVDIFMEVFNVTNHVNFRPPLGNPPNAGASVTAPAFLVRTAAWDARQVQWGLRYVF